MKTVGYTLAFVLMASSLVAEDIPDGFTSSDYFYPIQRVMNQNPPAGQEEVRDRGQALAAFAVMVAFLSSNCHLYKNGSIEANIPRAELDTVSNGQSMQTWINWMKENPDSWKMPLAFTTILALQKSYPCK